MTAIKTDKHASFPEATDGSRVILSAVIGLIQCNSVVCG